MNFNKKLIAVLLTVTLFLFGCNRGKTIGVNIHLDESKYYSEAEIMQAVDLILDQFEKGFDGCTMMRLIYDEERSNAEATGWAEQYGAEEAIVFYSSFETEENAGKGSLESNSSYEGWKWVLTRNSGEKWKLQTCGFG